MSEEKESTYEVKVFCTNCEHTNTIKIPKGTPIVLAKCPDCGCTKLEKSFEDE